MRSWCFNARSWRRWVAFGYLSGLLLGWMCLPSQRSHRAESTSLARLTPQQIMDHADAFHRFLFPHATQLHEDTFSLELKDENGVMQPVCAVNCRDPKSGQSYCSFWNANTGSLVRIVQGLRNITSGQHTAGKQAAITESLRWIQCAGVTAAASNWKLMGQPSLNRWNWIITWRSGQSKVIVSLDCYNLDLIRMGVATLSGVNPPVKAGA